MMTFSSNTFPFNRVKECIEGVCVLEKFSSHLFQDMSRDMASTFVLFTNVVLLLYHQELPP